MADLGETREEDLLEDESFMLDTELNSKPAIPFSKFGTNDIQLDHMEEKETLASNEYLSIYKVENSLRVEILMANYDFENQEEKFELMFMLSQTDIQYLTDFFKDYSEITFRSDGCSLRNPGRAGAGLAIFGKPKFDKL